MFRMELVGPRSLHHAIFRSTIMALRAMTSAEGGGGEGGTCRRVCDLEAITTAVAPRSSAMRTRMPPTVSVSDLACVSKGSAGSHHQRSRKPCGHPDSQ